MGGYKDAMESEYTIWNPHIVGGPSSLITTATPLQHLNSNDDLAAIEFFLVEASTNSISSGTKGFIQRLLADIGISVGQNEIVNWSFQNYRTRYFSDYVEEAGGEEVEIDSEADWSDVWQYVRLVRVVLANPTALSTWASNSGDSEAEPYLIFESDAIDEIWTPACQLSDGDETSVVGCLVICDFKSTAVFEKARAAIEADTKLQKLAQKYKVVAPPQYEMYCLPDVTSYIQVQIDLGPFPNSFFRKGADYAERVITLCRKKGKGITHYLELDDADA